MKYLSLILISFFMILCSCNHSEPPTTQISLPITEVYLPVTLTINKGDKELAGKIKDWDEKKCIVNDFSELPNDPIGFSKAYDGIDFTKYTLLVTYSIRSYIIETYTNRFIRNRIENSYNWYIHVGTSTIPDSNAEEWFFTRYAILVQKLPSSAPVNMYVSTSALNWDWDE